MLLVIPGGADRGDELLFVHLHDDVVDVDLALALQHLRVLERLKHRRHLDLLGEEGRLLRAQVATCASVDLFGLEQHEAEKAPALLEEPRVHLRPISVPCLLGRRLVDRRVDAELRPLDHGEDDGLLLTDKAFANRVQAEVLHRRVASSWRARGCTHLQPQRRRAHAHHQHGRGSSHQHHHRDAPRSSRRRAPTESGGCGIGEMAAATSFAA
mmetsp:Transcript_14320/g.37644  ORF Transcript_14320/g.37644 Transcript_14320/m.37644 type:complete len:212 (-) Transcript_14320:45-680(-)